jgi:hypothetical protein
MANAGAFVIQGICLMIFEAKKCGFSPLRVAVVAGALTVLGACSSTNMAGLNPAELDREALFQRQLALEEQVLVQRQVEDVSFRVMTAAAEFCPEAPGAAYGFTAANRHSFGANMREAATAAFGLDDSVRILSVAKGSPAAQAGVSEGDVITRVNGTPIGPGKDSVDTVAKAMSGAGMGGLALNIGGTNPRQVMLKPVASCNYPIEIVNSDKVNAYADGENIRITKGMMWFSKGEEDLAMVISHELAHNIMGHAGTFSSVFQDKKSREADADYVGLYIMARGGFEIEKASGFWRRMAAAFPRMIESSSSHPLMPARFVAIRETTEEIRQREAKGLPLVPQRVESLALAEPTGGKQPES